jgi:hypothetical protein
LKEVIHEIAKLELKVVGLKTIKEINNYTATDK